MADPELVAILWQGSEAWNLWRGQHPGQQLDLSEANLQRIILREANLNNTNLRSANLKGADLSRAFFNNADLHKANLSNVNMSRTDLRWADLSDTKLCKAFLSGTFLQNANLSRSDLSEAILNGTDLRGANLSDALLNGARLNQAYLNGTHLDGVNLYSVILSETIFARVDLRKTNGLTALHHEGPSHVELHTVQLPQDGSALHFLRGTGLSDEWIDDYCARMMHPIQYHSCFISYSSKDEAFARRLHADLQDRGVRCWFAPEEMKIGDKIRSRIDEAVHLQDKLLLLLSEHALASSWVEVEVEAALEKEQRQGREVLFPVRLDESVMQTTQAWAKQLRRGRYIGDFTNWTDPQAYEQAFARLLRDLKAQT